MRRLQPAGRMLKVERPMSARTSLRKVLFAWNTPKFESAPPNISKGQWVVLNLPGRPAIQGCGAGYRTGGSTMQHGA